MGNHKHKHTHTCTNICVCTNTGSGGRCMWRSWNMLEQQRLSKIQPSRHNLRAGQGRGSVSSGLACLSHKWHPVEPLHYSTWLDIQRTSVCADFDALDQAIESFMVHDAKQIRCVSSGLRQNVWCDLHTKVRRCKNYTSSANEKQRKKHKLLAAHRHAGLCEAATTVHCQMEKFT